MKGLKQARFRVIDKNTAARRVPQAIYFNERGEIDHVTSADFYTGHDPLDQSLDEVELRIIAEPVAINCSKDETTIKVICSEAWKEEK